jgi:hypothetical protein
VCKLQVVPERVTAPAKNAIENENLPLVTLLGLVLFIC